MYRNFKGAHRPFDARLAYFHTPTGFMQGACFPRSRLTTKRRRPPKIELIAWSGSIRRDHLFSPHSFLHIFKS